MEKRHIKNEAVSLLGFGCMRFPTANGRIDTAEAEKMLHWAYEQGVNYFDTAYPYHNGESESCLGNAMRGYPRDSYYIADKYPSWLLKSEDDIDRIFNEQLERLGTDYIDFYLVHSMERNHLPAIRENHLYERLLEKKKAGQIRYLGFSFHDKPEVLAEILAEHEWDFAQIQMNYYDWSYMQSESLYTQLTDKGIPVVVMEPVRGGFLANPGPRALELTDSIHTTPAALALRWVAQYPNVSVILSGMTTMEQLRENAALFASCPPVTAEENAVAAQIATLLSESRSIPCTGCRYCMDCPFGVDIPELFRVYNHYKVVGDAFRTGITYKYYFDAGKKPENCTECGACTALCPQHINIPEELKTVASTLNAL